MINDAHRDAICLTIHYGYPQQVTKRERERESFAKYILQCISFYFNGFRSQSFRD